MGINSLEIGKRGLLASRIGLDITSNNIANVNTEGYSRRVATTSETDPYINNGKFLGTGVLVDKIRNYREEFFDKEIRNSESRKSAFEQDSQILKRVESILAEPSELGLNEVVAEFFNGFEQLSLQPENVSLRENLLFTAQRMTDRFNLTSSQISDLRNEIAQSADVDIEKANQLIGEIAGLNGEVQKAASYDGVGAQTFIDEREKKLEELSKLLDVNITKGEFGTVNVFVNGMNIITGVEFSKLKIREKIDTTSGDRSIQLVKFNKQNVETVIKATEGELGSLLKHYNVTLNGITTDSGFSVVKQLDDFVNSLVKNVNSVTVGGYGLLDKTSPSPGRIFFEPAVGKATAGNIKLSDDVMGQPENIPLSGFPNEPGNNDVARKIGRLSVDKNFLNNQTPTEYYTNMLGQLGQLSKNAASGSETTAIVSEQLNNQRESVIGVNMDEEAINLIKYQKAFEASSRVIATTNSMLSTIINLGR